MHVWVSVSAVHARMVSVSPVHVCMGQCVCSPCTYGLVCPQSMYVWVSVSAVHAHMCPCVPSPCMYGSVCPQSMYVWLVCPQSMHVWVSVPSPCMYGLVCPQSMHVWVSVSPVHAHMVSVYPVHEKVCAYCIICWPHPPATL